MIKGRFPARALRLNNFRSLRRDISHDQFLLQQFDGDIQ
jgi:hypothetical protein